MAMSAEARLLGGRLVEAQALAEETLALSRRRGERGWEAWILRLLGEIERHRDSPGPSAEHYWRALALATELEMRPLAAHCHAGLAALHRRTGDDGRATDHLATATTLYREMGMTYWLEKLEGDPRR